MLRLLISYALSAAALAAIETVWVSRQFTGGPLCATAGPEINFIAPGFEATSSMLTQHEIKIYRSYFRDHATCQACGKCPAYHREIFFEIETSKTIAADKAGFRKPLAAPAESELAEFERSKVYRPPADLPAEE